MYPFLGALHCAPPLRVHFTLRHPSPPRTPGSVRGGGFRPTINHQPHALKYSPAGPEISRKTSFNLGNPPPFKLCIFVAFDSCVVRLGRSSQSTAHKQ